MSKTAKAKRTATAKQHRKTKPKPKRKNYVYRVVLLDRAGDERPSKMAILQDSIGNRRWAIEVAKAQRKLSTRVVPRRGRVKVQHRDASVWGIRRARWVTVRG